MLKTFWSGVGGWADTQLPDGTVEFTSPSGRIYTATPGGGQFFPTLATQTGGTPIRKSSVEPEPGRGLMMPRRRRTRAEEQRDPISAERRINAARIAEQRRQNEAWLAETYEPPPF